MAIFQEPVADGLGGSGLSDDVAPFLDGHLTGDHDGPFQRPLLDHVKEDPSLISIEHVRAQVVQDQ